MEDYFHITLLRECFLLLLLPTAWSIREHSTATFML